MIYFLFASHCAVGCLLSLSLVPTRLTGGGFPRFISGLVLFFLLSALLAGGGLSALQGRGGGVSPAVLAAYAAAAFPVAAGALLKEDRPGTRTFLLIAALLPSLAGFFMDTLARSRPGSSPVAAAVTIASFLAAALAAGSVCVAMILGHFYLVIPRLSIRPLILLCRVLVGALAARLVLAAATFFTLGSPTPGVSTTRAATFLWQNLAVEEGLIFWPRMTAGLMAPLVLAFMAWRTARIRSTQSATGILYVAVVFTTIGEFLGRFLFLTTRIPL
jgi:hypothetical protein